MDGWNEIGTDARDRHTLNILLNLPQLHHAPTLRRINNLGDEILMRHRFSRFHDPHDSRLRLVLAILVDALVRLLVLLLGLFQLDLVDLDAEFRIPEVRVDGERIGSVDVPAIGVLGQDAELGACERLQRALELGVDEAGGGRDVRVGEVPVGGDVVEEHEDDGLEAGHDEFACAFVELRSHDAMGESVLP